jgi:hypothetical protein
MSDAWDPAITLADRLKSRPLLVWAILTERVCEIKSDVRTQAFVAGAFLCEEAARRAAATATADARGVKWHVRSYSLFADGYGGSTIWPAPTPAEPTTVTAISLALRDAGLI